MSVLLFLLKHQSNDAKRNNAQLSNVHFSKALEIANKIDNKSLISDVYLAKSNSYKEQNKFSEALADFESHVKYKDSVLSDNNQKNINEIEIKYETEKKEKALVAQELKLSKQEEAYQKKKVQNSIMTATAIVLLITSILLFLFSIFMPSVFSFSFLSNFYFFKKYKFLFFKNIILLIVG